MLKRIIITILAALALLASICFSGCQVLNPYKAPEVDTLSLFREINFSSGDTVSMASLPWREFFTDSHLQNLIDEALQNNFDMQIALTRIRQAEVALSIARASYLPQVYAAGSAQYSRIPKVEVVATDPVTGQPTETKTKALGGEAAQFTLLLGMSWELDIWGKLNRQNRATYAQYLNSIEGKYLVQTNLVAGIATAYYTLLSLDEKLRISRESVKLLEETVSTMEQMMQQGFLNAASVEQTKAALYSTQITIPDLETAIRSLESTISLLTGRPGGAIERSTFAAQNVPAEFKSGVPAQILAKRPDVRMAELNFRAAFELTNVAQASLYPSITIGSSGNPTGIGFYQAPKLSELFNPLYLMANIVGGITQPIFYHNQLTGQVKVRQAQQDEALLTFQKTLYQAGNEVSDLLYSIGYFDQKNEYRSKQVDALSKSVEYTQLLLSANEANYLEVITAESNLLQAQLGQVNDKLAQLQASIDLYKALGGGIE